MTRVHVEAARSINIAAAKRYNGAGGMGGWQCCAIKNNRKEVSGMVEFDNMKLVLSNYEQPLLEMGNSL